MNLLRYRKIWACSCLLLCLLVLASPAWAAEAEPVEAELVLPYAKAAILMEARSGRTLFRLNSETPLPPASTTKILTALLALDMGADMDKPRLISQEAAAVGDMSLHLRAGEELSLKELLQGALVHSGNDACYAIGQIVAGSEPLFVHWMNMKAAALGAYSARLANTNGLPAPEHLLSAADLALLARCALENSFFAATVASKYVSIGQGASARRYQNTNKLLWQDRRMRGVKTGTTDAAGPCLVAALEDGEALYISVVMDSPDRYGESYSLLRYAADEYMLIRYPCAGSVLACLPEGRGKGIRRLRAGDDLLALVREKDIPKLRWQWELTREGGSLALMDGEGKTWGRTELFYE